MIHGLYSQIAAAVKAKGMPFEFIYGPPQVPTTVGATRLFMARDLDAGDQIGPVRGQRRNAKRVATRAIGVMVRIYAHSTIEGAQRHNHEGLADQIADAVLVAIHNIVRKARADYRVVRAGLVPLETTDGWSGVAYEIRFQIDRSVASVSWLGAAQSEGTFTTPVTAPSTSGPDGSDLPSATTRIL